MIVGVRPRVSAALGAPTRKVPGASGPRQGRAGSGTASTTGFLNGSRKPVEHEIHARANMPVTS